MSDQPQQRRKTRGVRKGSKSMVNFSLSDYDLSVIDSLIDLRIEADKAKGTPAPKGSKEFLMRYGRSSVLSECIQKAAPEITRELKEILDRELVSRGKNQAEQYNDADEILKRRLFNLDGRGWTSI